MKAIEKYNWPGNVRELQNVIERSLNRCTTEVLSIECLPDEIQTYTIDIPSDQNLESKKDVLQKQALLEVLMNCDYNYSKAAKKLNISRSTLYRRLERFNLR
jgi:transcriptional regulator with PAS, ATPase and Fis domain